MHKSLKDQRYLPIYPEHCKGTTVAREAVVSPVHFSWEDFAWSKTMGFRESRSGGDENQGLELLMKTPMFKGLQGLTECLIGYMEEGEQIAKGCKVSIWVSESRVKICIGDDVNDRVAFSTLDSSMGLGEALNKVCDNEDLDWKENKHSRRK